MSNTMPPFIYGTAWKKDKTADLVYKAIRNGFKGIDTACQPKHYNEAGVGEALRKLADEGLDRNDLYIQTKFTPIDGQDPNNIPYNKLDPLAEQMIQSFQASQKNLNVSYVDGLILHSPLETFEQTIVAWKALELIHTQGGAKRIGISNCYDLDYLKEIYSSASIKPTILQNRFYQATGYDHELRRWCREKEITYQSFWTLTANPQILSSRVIQKAAQTYQKTPAQILFRVLVHMGIVPLTGTTSEQHMKEDLEIFTFSLPETVIQEIASLFN